MQDSALLFSLFFIFIFQRNRFHYKYNEELWYHSLFDKIGVNWIVEVLTKIYIVICCISFSAFDCVGKRDVHLSSYISLLVVVFLNNHNYL